MSWQFTYSGGLTVWKNKDKAPNNNAAKSMLIIAETGDTKKANEKNHCMNIRAGEISKFFEYRP